jgi:hypothetical protein
MKWPALAIGVVPYHQLLRDDPPFEATAARLKVVLPFREQTNADAERLMRAVWAQAAR